MSLLPRFIAHDVEPLFRLMDDFSHQAFRSIPSQVHRRAFQPRFNLKETKTDYQLEGEVPGVAQKDVSIEFVDPQTMRIKARSEHVSERGTRPTAAAVEAQTETKKIESADASAQEASSSRQATVEAEGEKPQTQAEQQAVEKAEPTQQATPEKTRPDELYWISERSIGEFRRTFNFPHRVNQDLVKASLKNGILSIIVPKITDPVTKKINVE